MSKFTRRAFFSALSLAAISSPAAAVTCVCVDEGGNPVPAPGGNFITLNDDQALALFGARLFNRFPAENRNENLISVIESPAGQITFGFSTPYEFEMDDNLQAIDINGVNEIAGEELGIDHMSRFQVVSPTAIPSLTGNDLELPTGTAITQLWVRDSE